MLTAGVPATMWPHAIAWAYYLHNRLPSSVLKNSPFEEWNSFAPTFHCTWVWGCDVTVHIPKEKRTGKFARRAFKAAFLGVDGDDSGVYWCWDPVKRQPVKALDVHFDEAAFTIISKLSGYQPNRIGHSIPQDSLEPVVCNKSLWKVKNENPLSETSQVDAHYSSPSSEDYIASI